ncbi:hybrid sensor histidine kinase/response regulator [Rhodobacteraceae bacterium HSP-20]|uniref:histidine kinase n=1 Tax=Paragemmobacter amnigenus TaxID=2852097 RepID=A0ABS6J151_9RHOB|nr:hybrid sensor histidine kinase/response regulator [Rhodobacter amnigenus]MBU9697300.1 hybrid sensor histidine kinase/response regulator [Rhodobacter amnigenus]MBV4388527.1 hybrid sensor histidine kinase/response regulator [Rhodobacter amnigenus]
MLTDVRPPASGPEGLFSAISGPRHPYVPLHLAQRPLAGSAIFALVAILFSLLLTLGQLEARDNGALVDLLPSEAVFALLVGTAVFPLRMLAVPVLIYALCFTLCFLLRAHVEPGYLPAAVAPVKVYLWAMVLNALPALGAALAGRALAGRFHAAPVRRDVVLSLSTTLAYVLLAGAGVTVVVHGVYRPDWPMADFGDLSVVQAGLIRAVRIGVCGAVLLLYMLNRPDRRQGMAAMAVLPLFVGLGLLRAWGFSVHPTLDVELLALAVALLAPTAVAIPALIAGVCAYVVVTGEFLVQISVTSVDVLRLEIVSLVLLVLIYLLLLQRHAGMAERARQRATIDRLARVQALATIGYFVVDLDRGEVRVDPVAATILGTDKGFGIAAFLRRVRPADAAAILAALADRTQSSRTLSFLLSPHAAWSDEGEARYIVVHAWYEAQSGGAMLAYGALIDLTADHRREVALGSALATLSEQQDRQTQMFSIVSHELRTPASVISMLVEELDNGATWDAMGSRLRAVSDQLLSVLGDMRQAVRPEQNLPVRMEVLVPQDLAATVRHTFLLMAEAKGIDIDLDLAPEAWEPRQSDRVRLMQALSNLVKNAILHSGCRRITIGYTEEISGDGIVGLWRVTDDGRGIPDEARPTLFDAFRRGGGTATARTDGSGLGLYVTKSSIELLGGSVSHAPRGAGGSVFLLRVPMGRVPVAAAPAEDAARAEAPLRAAQKVLIVEDSDLMGELMVARLKRVFGAVVWARDGIEALELFARETPDIVLTDLFMPQMGGDDLTAALRAKGARCPIIGMTAAAIGDERERFEAAGTDCVLTKPVSTAQLLAALDGRREGAA